MRPLWCMVCGLLCVGVESGRRWKVTLGDLHAGCLVFLCGLNMETHDRTISCSCFNFKSLSGKCVLFLSLISNQISGHNGTNDGFSKARANFNHSCAHWHIWAKWTPLRSCPSAPITSHLKSGHKNKWRWECSESLTHKYRDASPKCALRWFGPKWNNG